MSRVASSSVSRTPRQFDEAEVIHPAGVDGRYRRVVGEFWTAQQRQMSPLHYVISYRASFKPELPAYFIERLCPAGGVVCDPFSGRGTTALQANLMGCTAVAGDINPLAVRMTQAKCRPVTVGAVERRLAEADLDAAVDVEAALAELPGWRTWGDESHVTARDLTPFYHPRTLRQLLNLRRFLARPDADDTDRFIELVALSRLHGHSGGFFSAYSFPQISVPPEAQRRINRRGSQRPKFRPLAERIIRKARRSLEAVDVEAVRSAGRDDRFFVAAADALPPAELPDESADLIVTSPPFLAKADYLLDNWLEFWFAGVDPRPLARTLVQTPNLARWREFISRAMGQMARVLKPAAHAVIEVGEVVHDGAMLHLDEVIVDLASECGLRIAEHSSLAGPSRMTNPQSAIRNPQSAIRNPQSAILRVVEVLIHTQKFTKLANCFKVSNNAKGTNTHRLVVLRKN